MNLYSEEFLKDTKSVPIRKHLYVYLWRNNKITEFLAEFRVYDYELKNIESYRNRPSCTVQLLKNLTDDVDALNDRRVRISKSFTISIESGEVNNGKVWLPYRDLTLAKECFIKDREKRIDVLSDKVKLFKDEIKALKNL